MLHCRNVPVGLNSPSIRTLLVACVSLEGRWTLGYLQRRGLRARYTRGVAMARTRYKLPSQT